MRFFYAGTNRPEVIMYFQVVLEWGVLILMHIVQF